MILRAQAPTPRLRYAAEVLFARCLQTPVTVVSLTEPVAAEQPQLVYAARPAGDFPFVEASGALANNGPAVRGTQSEGRAMLLGQDPFAQAFAACTEYECWTAPALDAHGRYDETASTVYRAQLYRTPFVQVAAEGLARQVQQRFPGWRYRAPAFRVAHTFDIDQPWRWAHKPVVVRWGRALLDWLQASPEVKNERRRARRSGHDPYATYASLFRHFSAAETLVFFLLNGKTPFDNRFTAATPALGALVQEFVQRGYEIGLHPGYATATNAAALQEQHRALGQLLGRPVTAARQHYAKYRYPDTPRNYLAEDFTDDYSAIPVAYVGFKYGLAVPFPWYDVARDEMTTLEVHPTLVMDRSLQKYQRLTPEAALNETRRVLGEVRAHGGTFRWLLHNDTLADAFDWRGWAVWWQGVLAATSHRTFA